MSRNSGTGGCFRRTEDGSRPPDLIAAALSWLAGTLAALWLVPTESSLRVVLSLCAAVMIAAYRWRCGWLIWMVAAIAWSWVRIEARVSDQLAPELVGEDLHVSGWVDDFPSGSSRQVRFSFEIDDASADAKLPHRIRLTWYDPPFAVHAGAALDLIVRLRRPHGLANPGGLDYERWLFERGIGATGYVRSGTPLLDPDNQPARVWLELRAKLAERIRISVASPGAQALLVALTIGERSGFDDAYWTTLRRTGTSHLVAISGLHIGIVGALLFALARWLWLRGPAGIAGFDLEVASAASLLGAAAYAALAGLAIPTQRALIMLGTALAAVVLRRVTSGAAALSAALLFVLVWDPMAPLSASFWLSFIAVAVLWQLARQQMLCARASRTWVRVVRGAARTQWGITLGLMPLAVLLFGEISFLSPVVNLVAIPLFGLVLVPLALAATAALMVVEPVGAVLLACAAELADGVNWMLTSMAAIGWSSVPIPELGFVAVLLLLAGSVCVLPVHPLPGRYLGWLPIAAALVMPAREVSLGGVRATVLDVGHGLAVLIETREHVLLYDTGARSPSGFDAGRDVVLPAARRLGIRRIDRVLVSHADNDHAGGLEAVLAEYPSAAIVAGPDVERSGAQHCRRGDRWEWDGVHFDILHPPAAYPAKGNEGSCVLRVSAGGHTLLLTGDIERRGEAELVSAVPDLAADVVVVPHHGSATSSSAAITAATGARYAIVSAGYANRWGFPKAAVIDRWKRAGAQSLVTSDAGAIQVSFGSGGRLSVATERGRWRRPWEFTAPR